MGNSESLASGGNTSRGAARKPFYTFDELRRPEHAVAAGFAAQLQNNGSYPPGVPHTYEDVADELDPPSLDRPDHTRGFALVGKSAKALRDADFWVSIDTGSIAFRPSKIEGGQYFHPMPEADTQFGLLPAPENRVEEQNIGGYHQAVIDLGDQPAGLKWNVVARLVTTDSLARPGSKKAQELRVERVWVARQDHQFRSEPMGNQEDECRCLVLVTTLELSGEKCRVVISDAELGSPLEGEEDTAATTDEFDAQVPVLAGLGDGLYPINLLRNSDGAVTAVSVRFLHW
eukprot:TRINITY_DN5608_c0_g1_i1.p1 TRINITY_DN5608_c0_g1~~TRINITY_DN5608_c0_g1_i1.p1  ORF type:complete len:288 (-),score=51.74 TRINITY_DN5608_c0_g1_i1:153-1016(-)